MKFTKKVKMLALALGIVCTQSAPAQTFKRVNVQGGAALIQIAPGGASVWALASSGHPYIFKTNKFVLANNIYLCQIAVGGGNTLQADAVWGLDCSSGIYRATRSGTSWVFSLVPGALDFIAVGAGYNDSCHPYEVWGLHANSIYRFNYCVGNWDSVPGSLATLAVGGGDILGINDSGQIYRFNFATLGFDLIGGGSVQITAGPSGAWALNLYYQPRDVYADHKLYVPGQVPLTQIQAGGNGV